MGVRLTALGIAGFEAVACCLIGAFRWLVAELTLLGFKVSLEFLQAVILGLVAASGFQVPEEFGVIVRGCGIAAYGLCRGLP